MAVTMNARWDNNGTVIPGGDAEYVVAEQPIAEYDNWFNHNIVADVQAVIDEVINKFDANTILKADTDNDPAALTVAEQTIVGRKTGNSIAALTDAEVLVIIGVEAGATADQTGAEIKTLYEAEVDAYTDAKNTKLSGIETAADVTDVTNVAAAGATMESLFDANTILKADADDTPAALTVAEQTLVGRITAGVITALTATQVRTLINVADGSDVTGSNAPQTHGSSHTEGGSDEITYYDIDYAGYVVIDANTYSQSPASWAKVVEYTLVTPQDPQKFSFDLKSTSTNQVKGRLYVDGVPTGTEHTGVSASYVTKTDVLTGLSGGEKIQLYLHGHSTATAYATNFEISGKNVKIQAISGGWT